MLINFAVKSKILPQAAFLEPKLFSDFFNLPIELSQCPATSYFNKNFYVVSFPFDFESLIKINKDQIIFEYSTHDPKQDWITFNRRQNNLVDMQLNGFAYYFWSDKDCYSESWGSEILQATKIYGSYNIKNWIRAIHPSYVIDCTQEQKIPIKFKRGDPWLFVRFQTKEKVNLKYNFDKSIIEEAKKMAESTEFLSGYKKYFNIFSKIRPKKLTK